MVHFYTDKTTEINQQTVNERTNDPSAMKVVKNTDIFEASGLSKGPVSSYEGQKFMEDFLGSLGITDVEIRRNYMTIMSNTLSDEDYAKLTEDGVNPARTDVGATVNALDRIKATLCEAGIIIPGYNDDLSPEQLKDITGSDVTANAIERAFRDRYIPLTRENVEKAVQVFNQAAEIPEITDGMCDYLLRNALEPTVDHLYRVRFSGATVPLNNSGYYTDSNGYMARQGEEIQFANLEGRIQETIEQSGLPLDEETIAESKWLIESGILYNETNLSVLHSLRHMEMPMDADRLADAVGNALMKGRAPKDALLNDTANYYKEAVRIKEDIEAISDDALDTVAAEEKQMTIKNLREASKEGSTGGKESQGKPAYIEEANKARLALEQIRLKMTVEASVSMMKRGITIDTTALTELVNTLEALEDETNRLMFGSTESKEALQEKSALYHETNRQVAELPFLPAGAVGRAIQEYGTITISKVYEAGVAMQKMYESMAQTYEAVGTEVRSDLGDSITKAFQNVDELLKEQGFIPDEENRRAVRILGYNEMEITRDNIDRVQEADGNLRAVLAEMTPGRVLELIRTGVNPLEASLDDLSRELNKIEKSPLEAVDDYARFLHKLDSKKEITSEERESYIGIYRLMKTIDRSDGAALGSLIKGEREINLQNLLSAVRSRRKEGMDYKVDEDFGEQTGEAGLKFSISGQIMAGFREVNEGSKEEARDFYSEEIRWIRESLEGADAAVEQLIHMGEPVTPEAVAAMTSYLEGNVGNSPWKVLKDMEDRKEEALFEDTGKPDGTEEPEELPFTGAMRGIKESFTDRESIKKAYDDMLTSARKVLEDVALKEGVGRIDLKELSLSFRQLELMQGMLGEENYEVPVEFDGIVSGMRVRIIHKGEQSGNVVSSFTSEKFGTVSAQFTFTNGKLEGLIAGDSEKGLEALKNSGVEEAFKGTGLTAGDFHYVFSEKLNPSNSFIKTNSSEGDRISTKELYQVAKTFIETVERVG